MHPFIHPSIRWPVYPAVSLSIHPSISRSTAIQFKKILSASRHQSLFMMFLTLTQSTCTSLWELELWQIFLGHSVASWFIFRAFPVGPEHNYCWELQKERSLAALAKHYMACMAVPTLCMIFPASQRATNPKWLVVQNLHTSSVVIPHKQSTQTSSVNEKKGANWSNLSSACPTAVALATLAQMPRMGCQDSWKVLWEQTKTKQVSDRGRIKIKIYYKTQGYDN